MGRIVTCGAVLFLALVAARADAQSPKLDVPLTLPATLLTGRSQVIVQPLDASVDLLIQWAGGTLGRPLPRCNGGVANVPNTPLATLAGNALVQKVALDRKTIGLNERTGVTVGATAVRNALGYDGSGVGVAIIDSGITQWHDDLTDPGVIGSQRVAQFVDFVNGQTVPYDDYGHGTHVAGIVAGNGFDSSGARAGIAPGARLVVLKALDSSGTGRVSDVIAALDYVVNHKGQFNIRVVNLSVATAVYESYTSDLLAQATRQAVEHGIVVVAAAGNRGRSSGHPQYGGITAPGNAPWVLTVGASSHMGTIDRSDDTIAAFSSRGPTAVDRGAKPDLVAPGVGIESLSAPGSTFYSQQSSWLLAGTIRTRYLPYLSQSGTSMSAPVVSGVVALMLQANQSLTPGDVKAILLRTARMDSRYDVMTQGAGFLDAKAAVDLAITWIGSTIPNWFFVGAGGAGGDGSAWGTSDGDTLVWGTSDGDTGVWGTSCTDPSCTPVIWNQ